MSGIAWWAGLGLRTGQGMACGVMTAEWLTAAAG
jgi:hypothetical protein